jgi:uncharacterized protein (TIGR00369 family)
VLTHSLAELQRYFDARMGLSGAAALGEVRTATDFAAGTVIEALEEDRLRVRRTPDPSELRPGGIVSGPSLISLVDAVGWMMAVAHLPPGSDALTTDLSVRFLRPAPFAALVADVRLLRAGRRSTQMDVMVTSDAVEGPVTHATIGYAPWRVDHDRRGATA